MTDTSTKREALEMSSNKSSTETFVEGRLTEGEFTVVTSFLVACGATGLIENALIFMVFAQVSKLRSPTNVFVMTLSICDVIVSILGIPFSAAASASNGWIFGDVGCSWYGFIMSFVGYSSIFILTAISVERYLLITKPLSRQTITAYRVNIVILFCGLLALVLAALPLVGWSSYALEGAFISCSVNWQSKEVVDISYVVAVFLLCYILPVGIMGFAYFSVFRTVRSLAHCQLWGTDSHVHKRNLKMEYRTARNVLLMIGAFLLCWTPYSVVSFCAALGDPELISPAASTIPALFAKSSIVWNPLVYVMVNKQFRNTFWEVYPCKIFTRFRRKYFRNNRGPTIQVDAVEFVNEPLAPSGDKRRQTSPVDSSKLMARLPTTGLSRNSLNSNTFVEITDCDVSQNSSC